MSPETPPHVPAGVTRELARYAVRARYEDLPGRVQAEAPRAFLNWMGCTLGGAREPAVGAAAAVADAEGGAPKASLIGLGRRTDIAGAAFVNCLASSVLAFDDTHLATVTHPTGPVAAALFAWSESHPVRGKDFLAALVVGMEIQCRLSNMLLLPPAVPNVGLYVTGLSGPMGAAAALGRLLGLDEERMSWAVGLATAQAAGLRATHGSMAAYFVPAQAARSGVVAATLAAAGFTCTDGILEARNGFAGVFSPQADPAHALDRLGERFEVLSNTYKPYPCGIVIHPLVDACLEIAARLPPDAGIASVSLRLHPLALALTARRSPADPLLAQISLFHWAAAVLLRRTAGTELLHQSCIDDPEIAALRLRIDAEADPSLDRDAAVATVTLADGAVFREHVEHARGSLARPMSDDELDGKFDRLAAPAIGAERATRLRRVCRGLAEVGDVGTEVAACWDDPDRPA